jgi:hypothetical protein
MSTSSVSMRAVSSPSLKHSSTQSQARLPALSLGRIFLCAFFTLVFFAATTQSVFADLIVQVGNAQVTEGGSGYIDVFFQFPGGTTQTYALAGYVIELDLSGPTSNVLFTQFGEPQNAIFPGSTPNQTLSRPSLPGNIAAANDQLPVGENPIVNNAGLIRVNFQSESGSAGSYNVTIDPTLSRTNFSNGSSILLSDLTTIHFQSGTITVNPVPEPTILTLLLITVSLLLFRWKSASI